MAPLSSELDRIGRVNGDGSHYQVTDEKILSLPDSISNLTGLKALGLHGCKALKELPASIGNLTGLEGLNLTGCKALVELPASISCLTALQWLELAGCTMLQNLPESIGSLTALQRLILGQGSPSESDSLGPWSLGPCQVLKELPASIGNLTSLQVLDLNLCTALEQLPESIGNLAGLQVLDVSNCEVMKELPKSIGNLSSLRRLEMRDCRALTQLPESIGNLTALHELELRNCYALKKLPESIGNLTALQTLDLSRCEALKELPESIGNLTALHTLNLGHCQALEELPESIGNLTALQTLNLESCMALKELPESIGNLTDLQTLDLDACVALEELPESLSNLELTHLGHFACPCFEGAPSGTAMEKSTWALNRLRNAQALLGQREILLTSVERMSWIGILFATATFVGFLNPPGSFNDGKLAMHYEVASSPPGLTAPPPGDSGEVSVANAGLLRAFFVMDQLSFFASLATVVVAVASSMPSTVYKSRMLEASKIWALLVVVSVLLSVAIVCGFLAFTFAALCLYPPQLLRADVVGPVVFGACLVMAGLWYHARSLWRSSPGFSNVWRWLWAGCFGCGGCCGRGGSEEGPGRTVDLSDAAEANRLLKEQSYQAKRTNALLAALTRARLSRGPEGYELVIGDANV